MAKKRNIKDNSQLTAQERQRKASSIHALQPMFGSGKRSGEYVYGYGPSYTPQVTVRANVAGGDFPTAAQVQAAIMGRTASGKAPKNTKRRAR